MAYHMRELDRINSMLSDFPHNNRWHEQWDKFKTISEDEEQALTWFTEYIQSQLDGGNCRLPEGL